MVQPVAGGRWNGASLGRREGEDERCDVQAAAGGRLGALYANGLGVKQDAARAFDYYRRSAEHGNPLGNVPQVLQFQNNFIPAQSTTAIKYAANLPSTPTTAVSSTAAPGTINALGGLAHPLDQGGRSFSAHESFRIVRAGDV